MIFFKELIKKLSSYIITYPKITMVISYSISSQVPRSSKVPRLLPNHCSVVGVPLAFCYDGFKDYWAPCRFVRERMFAKERVLFPYETEAPTAQKNQWLSLRSPPAWPLAQVKLSGSVRCTVLTCCQIRVWRCGNGHSEPLWLSWRTHRQRRRRPAYRPAAGT